VEFAEHVLEPLHVADRLGGVGVAIAAEGSSSADSAAASRRTAFPLKGSQVAKK
jgi:hypothetical protein